MYTCINYDFILVYWSVLRAIITIVDIHRKIIKIKKKCMTFYSNLSLRGKYRMSGD